MPQPWSGRGSEFMLGTSWRTEREADFPFGQFFESFVLVTFSHNRVFYPQVLPASCGLDWGSLPGPVLSSLLGPSLPGVRRSLDLPMGGGVFIEPESLSIILCSPNFSRSVLRPPAVHTRVLGGATPYQLVVGRSAATQTGSGGLRDLTTLP
jgi:hypothetical protein